MTRQQVEKALKGIPKHARAKTVCALIGHSRIVTACLGYISCARCEEQIGDTLGGGYDASSAVVVGHDCKHCRENAKTLVWKDTFMTPVQR